MFNPTGIYVSDLIVLLRLYGIPMDIVVYDPKERLVNDVSAKIEVANDLESLRAIVVHKRTLYNLSFKKLPEEFFNYCEYIIEFNTPRASHQYFQSKAFYFINNPDGTIRWLFPVKAETPVFLNLYNGSGWKAGLYKFVSKLTFKHHFQQCICNGKIRIYSPNLVGVRHLLLKAETANLAVFTGTAGKGRKAIIAIEEEDSSIHFIKTPITRFSEQLIGNEAHHIRNLSAFRLKNMDIPKLKLLSFGIKLTDVRPESSVNDTELKDVHFKAIEELYTRSFQRKNLLNLDSWRRVLDDILFLVVNAEKAYGLNKLKVRYLVGKLYDLSIKANDISQIPMAYTHGDFTPWNMYIGKDKLYVYDWEMARPTLPMLFDLFHFTFQSQVLIHRSPFTKIKEVILEMKDHPVVQNIIREYEIDFDLHYQLYLCFNCSYYLKLFLFQQPLHQQAHWLLDTWLEATIDSLETAPSRTLQTTG